MATSYPTDYDTFGVAVAGAAGHTTDHTNLGDAVEAIQAELGINPSGNSATVADRLNTVTSTAGLLYIRWTGATVPLRTTVTTDATRTVMWIGPDYPASGGGYAVAGVDIAAKIVS